MPVPKELKVNETAEIRCELKREGRWEDTRYTIRWFLFDGEGTLKLEDGTALLPNERYPLEKETFRLYFTPLSDEQSSFTVWVEDSDGQAVELEYDFNADNDKEDPLEKETFRLYFTPLSDEQSSFTVWVEDSDGQAVELEYDFNADNDKEDGDGTE